MAMPNSSPDIMPQAEALRALGLTGAADAEAVRAAFRARVRHADPARHGGCDARLRRLIQARDLLIQPVKTLQPTHDKKSLYASATELRLNLAEAIYGGEIACEVPALACHTDVASLLQTARLRVVAPPGLRDGQSVRLPTREGGWIACRVAIETEPGMRVWGDDIWMTASLTPHALRFGGRVVIDTPRGAHSLRLAGGAQDGASLRLTGLGLPAAATAPAGDLIVRLQADAAAIAAPHLLSAFRQRWAS